MVDKQNGEHGLGIDKISVRDSSLFLFKSDGESIRSIVKICKQFIGDREVVAIKREPFGTINKTYQVETIDGIYIVQKIGSSVFEKNIGALEDNYRNFINAYVRQKSAMDSFAIPQWIPDTDGHMIFQDQREECWRMYRYLCGDNLGTLTINDRVKIFAKTVAVMHTLLEDITDIPQSTISHFHDIAHYFKVYLSLRPERVRDDECETIIQTEINFILDNCIFEDNCVIHGDTLLEVTAGCTACLSSEGRDDRRAFPELLSGCPADKDLPVQDLRR